MTGSFRLLTAVTFTVHCYGFLLNIPFLFVAPFHREVEASYINLKNKRNTLYVKRSEALSIHSFLFVFGPVFSRIVLFPTVLEAGGRKRSPVCCEEEEEEEGEEEEGVPPTKSKRSSK